MAGFLRNRTVKYGGNAVTAVVIVLGILVITNYMASRYPKRMAGTRNGCAISPPLPESRMR